MSPRTVVHEADASPRLTQTDPECPVLIITFLAANSSKGQTGVLPPCVGSRPSPRRFCDAQHSTQTRNGSTACCPPPSLTRAFLSPTPTQPAPLCVERPRLQPPTHSPMGVQTRNLHVLRETCLNSCRRQQYTHPTDVRSKSPSA